MVAPAYLSTAHLILRRARRLSEDDKRTRTSVGYALSEPVSKETETRQKLTTQRPTITRQKLRVDPKSPTGSVQALPSEAPTVQGVSAKAPTREIPRASSSEHLRKSAHDVVRLIKKTRDDPNAPAWKRKLVKRPFEFSGTADYAAPESFHQDLENEKSSVKGRIKVTAKDPKEREAQHKEVARTIANAANKPTHSCRDGSGRQYTSTLPCPKAHTHLYSTDPTRTQRAMKRASISGSSGAPSSRSPAPGF